MMRKPITEYDVEVGDVVYRYDGVHGEVTEVETFPDDRYPVRVTMCDGEEYLYTRDGDYDLEDGPLGSSEFDLRFVRVKTEETETPVVTTVTYKGVEFTYDEAVALVAAFRR